MKQVKLTRSTHLSQATIGVLTVSRVTYNPIGDETIHFIDHAPIFTLENPKRKTKVDDRIPAGTYTCKPFSGAKYKNVYQVMDVPGRSAILLHHGNTEADTLGCILLGNRVGEINGQPAVLDSKNCFKRFRELIGASEFTLVVED
jgi:hypothetical protein